MAHDFKQFPELTNAQLEIYEFVSPHKQITEDFRALCVKVHDGDTITLRTNFRDFDFPLRLINISAPELDTGKLGEDSQEWLENRVLGRELDIIINPNNRVDKWGRLLGYVTLGGVDMGEASILAGKSVPWEARNDGEIPNIEKELKNLWA